MQGDNGTRTIRIKCQPLLKFKALAEGPGKQGLPQIEVIGEPKTPPGSGEEPMGGAGKKGSALIEVLGEPKTSPKREGKEEQAGDLQTSIWPIIGSPGYDEYVSSPFTAYGTLDEPGTENDVYLEEIGTGTRWNGVTVPAPPGFNWAVEFTVPGNDYKLFDVESLTTYVIPLLHVV